MASEGQWQHLYADLYIFNSRVSHCNFSCQRTGNPAYPLVSMGELQTKGLGLIGLDIRGMKVSNDTRHTASRPGTGHHYTSESFTDLIWNISALKCLNYEQTLKILKIPQSVLELSLSREWPRWTDGQPNEYTFLNNKKYVWLQRKRNVSLCLMSVSV